MAAVRFGMRWNMPDLVNRSRLKKIVRLVDKNGKTKVWNCCTEFQTDDENLMAAYKSLFVEG